MLFLKPNRGGFERREGGGGKSKIHFDMKLEELKH
jgi:hypothetical protein